MRSDIAERCRTALEMLEDPSSSSGDLDAAAQLLRAAGGDLAAFMEIVRGQESDVHSPDRAAETGSFDLLFGSALGETHD